MNIPRMRCATQAIPDQTNLGRTRDVKRDQSTELQCCLRSGSAVYGLDSLIRTHPKSALSDQGTIYGPDSLTRAHPESARSDQGTTYSLDGLIRAPAQSLNSMIRAWSRVWIVLW